MLRVIDCINMEMKILCIFTIVLYIIVILFIYYFRGFKKLYEVSFIPVALYGGGRQKQG